MRYLQRDKTGKVIGHFANPQPGFADKFGGREEAVPDDHPEILAWKKEREDAKAAYMERKAQLDPNALLARIEELEALLRKR